MHDQNRLGRNVLLALVIATAAALLNLTRYLT